MADMEAMAAARRLVALVRSNADIARHREGCSLEMLGRAESMLGLLFPPSYRLPVVEFGTWGIGGEDFLGIYQTAAAKDELLGSVHETIWARESLGLPESMLVTSFDGMGGLIVLDTASLDEHGEAPVIAWMSGAGLPGQTEVLGTNFGTYSLKVCLEAVRRRRSRS